MANCEVRECPGCEKEGKVRILWRRYWAARFNDPQPTLYECAGCRFMWTENFPERPAYLSHPKAERDS